MTQAKRARREEGLPSRQAEPAGMIGEMLGSPSYLDEKELGFVRNIDGYARLRGTITDDQGTAIRGIYDGFRGRMGGQGKGSKGNGSRSRKTV
jgi:hypothetical protein